MVEGKKITHALFFLLSLGLNYAVDQGKLCGSRINEPGTLVKNPASHFLEGTSEYGPLSALNIMLSRVHGQRGKGEKNKNICQLEEGRPVSFRLSKGLLTFVNSHWLFSFCGIFAFPSLFPLYWLISWFRTCFSSALACVNCCCLSQPWTPRTRRRHSSWRLQLTTLCFPLFTVSLKPRCRGM